ncbi:glycosyltransferase family 2 protein [Massilia oculi]|uniref:glycosyltransferase family 2 protein n=1 Tax=Massilia oculi TaxID=945844 RepID=UPI001AAFEF8F|nr:glycosyltransferase [Massilia oculi]
MMTDSPSPAQAVTLAAPTRWHGAVEGLYNGQLFGWAFDSARPDARVVVEVCLDGYPCASVVADAARGDLASTIQTLAEQADVCHGFVADLGHLPEGSKGVLTCRIANNDAILAGAVSRTAPERPPAAAVSTVFGDGGLRLQGWALDPADTKRFLRVRAFDGKDMVTETVANIIHPFQRAYIDGAHGFELVLPPSLADGQSHSIRVVDEDGREVNGSPVTVCCAIDGLTGLLPQSTDELLQGVADYYERLLPRSLPMSYWPEWSARFDAAPPAPLPASVAKLKIGILITGEPGADPTQRSVQSIEEHGVTVQVFPGATFPAVLDGALATGCDVIVCIRPGDTLTPNALAHALEGFALPQAQVVYTDSEQNGHPWFKPAWNIDYALATDYPLDLLLVRAALAKELRQASNPAEFGWSALAAAHAIGEATIVHVPRVLYHRNSPLTELERASRAAAVAKAAEAIDPSLVLETLVTVPHGTQDAARRVRATLPQNAHDIKISLVIPTRDRADLLKRCIDTILQFTTWPSLELIVIDNGSTEPATHAYFSEIAARGVRVLAMPGPFNYADLNNRAIALASGEIVGLVNNDIEALHQGWLEEIVAHLLRPGVGAVGAKLLWPNGMVQHGGVLLGVGNVAGHFGNLLADGDWGDHGRNQLVQQVSGCTAACLFLRRQDFLSLGGMDADAFPVAFNDVDLCLKVRASGKVIIWTPHAKLLHAESASRGHEDTPQKKARAMREVQNLRQRWGHILTLDPTYHPCVNLDPNSHAFGGLALPPRQRKPRLNLIAP